MRYRREQRRLEEAGGPQTTADIWQGTPPLAVNYPLASTEANMNLIGPGPVVVFTPVHGAYTTAIKTCDAIAKLAPSPFIHLIGDDFSPKADADSYARLTGWVANAQGNAGMRICYHCRDLGVEESPNMGLSLGHAWRFARDLNAEALWVVESDVIPRAGIIEGYRKAVAVADGRVGAVSPLFTEVDGNAITTFGGMLGSEAPHARKDLGLRDGQEIGTWDMAECKVTSVTWAHLASLWITREALHSDAVMPDPELDLYYVDHDICRQLLRAGFEVIVSNQCVAEHTRMDVSMRVRWPDNAERLAVQEAAWQLFQKKG